MKKSLALIVASLLLTGCSSPAESKIAECTYYWDAANLTLSKWYEWDLSYQPDNAPDRTYKATSMERIYKDWAALILDAPSECFSDDLKKVAQENLK
jgi:hypothetical protein